MKHHVVAKITGQIGAEEIFLLNTSSILLDELEVSIKLGVVSTGSSK